MPLCSGTVQTVQAGETIFLRSAVIYVPYDPFNDAPTARFYGGNMMICASGGTNDVTPAEGIPFIGLPECEGILYKQSRPLPYLVTPEDAAAGRIIARASYTGNSSLDVTQPVKASSVLLVRVRPGTSPTPVPKPKAAQKHRSIRKPPVWVAGAVVQHRLGR